MNLNMYMTMDSYELNGQKVRMVVGISALQGCNISGFKNTIE